MPTSRSLKSDRQMAWVFAPGNLVLFANSADSLMFPWESAVSRLVAGVNEAFGEERYRFLRQRIHTTAECNPWDWQLVKVCAKRISWASEQTISDSTDLRTVDIGTDMIHAPDSVILNDHIGTTVTIAEAKNLLNAMLQKEFASRQKQKLHDTPRMVGALAVDGTGTLIAASVNSCVRESSSVNPLMRMQFQHAEYNLVLGLANSGMRHFPKGTTIYTTLKPCRMCATLLLEFTHPEFKTAAKSEAKGFINIRAFADDPGPHGRHKILEGILKIEAETD